MLSLIVIIIVVVEQSPSCEANGALSWSRNSPPFLKPECSSPCSQQHATGLYTVKLKLIHNTHVKAQGGEEV
jgi:hypothetical protein